MNRKERYTNMALREALIGLLMQKDIDKITVTQICERAGVNRATFYLRYNTLEEFYAALASEWAEDMVAEIQQKLDAASGEDVLLQSIVLPLENVKANRRVIPIILKNNSPALFEKTYEMVCAGLPDTAERRFRYRFFMEGTKGVVLHWLAEDCREDIDALAHRIAGTFKTLLFS